ncbi:glycogen synthase (ADP-glucose) [Nitrosococcus oceani ATCC 19707]|uniref:Glycogen synthase 2 n=2 Tax=Nitrosococcus oceani TaxID=1229 RepID=GLGA2_NITOC|nr:glycogen synthase GlgA [Nitrosococcus oceani]Q3JD12.1 RecName: Full=Glycogen synthase 2; AltName: Full=Starch [bacterial glycogen] synthase 2 [Nitrosococcus oceani ATCC 19707]KFI20260.1 glycogen synthase [Nitrosococcus oceani C-27]ABA57284.1 glycogen synthase (ADP-glucose) [Nitrosococcus oceani ATCC 19707]EDZ68343.1 glycogen/starch synthase, ADP-glucose type subfamily [Nitrosococcus oceani AFC27]GEM20158.1 glycogen synthase [Nitrosococcus oceani]
MYKILFATSEAHPLIKTGGLGDVAGILPIELARLGLEAGIILPAYPACKTHLKNLKEVARLRLPAALEPVRILKGQLLEGPNPVWLVDSPAHFDRPGNPYLNEQGQDWPDNAARFTTFCRAVATLANSPEFDWQPDLIHCNDWQTGLIPPFLAPLRSRPATLFTIHNLAYQGVFSRQQFDALELPSAWWSPAALEFYNQISFIKGGLVFADWLTTVSPTYAKEILTPEFGCGLDGVLRGRSKRLTGILNGADYQRWDPRHDPFIEKRYDQTCWSHKASNKLALQRRYGLPEDDTLPVLGFVGRLVEQKGIDLILGALPKLLAEKIQVVFLGEGEERHQNALQQLASRYPNQIGVSISYDERLAHGVQAGADIFLMPSRFEPCGLTQLYALRYGTVPIARRTGGLSDTIVDATEKNLRQELATGFTFTESSPSALLTAIQRALACYAQSRQWRRLALTGMAQNFSWQTSAKAYFDLYQQLVSQEFSCKNNVL